MKLKLIACNVFKREIEHCLSDSPHEIETDYIEIAEHLHPATLRRKIQDIIDRTAEVTQPYDATLLAYGLCGRSCDGLTARREQLVIPRSHDCAGILLGSRKRFEEEFSAMPSTPFSSPGYVEHGRFYFQSGELAEGEDEMQKLIQEYGEDNAKYIYEAMHPKLDGELQPVCYIDAPEFSFPDLMDKCRHKAEEEGRPFKILEGSLRLIRMLLYGEWPEDEFLTVQAGRAIAMKGDWDRIYDTVSANAIPPAENRKEI